MGLGWLPEEAAPDGNLGAARVELRRPAPSGEEAEGHRQVQRGCRLSAAEAEEELVRGWELEQGVARRRKAEGRHACGPNRSRWGPCSALVAAAVRERQREPLAQPSGARRERTCRHLPTAEGR